MKKIVIMLIGLVCALGLLAGCGGNTKETAAPETTTEAATTVEETTEEITTEETTEAETETTTEEDTEEQTTEEETEEVETENPDYPASEGWHIYKGLAVKINGYYFSEEADELMIDGMITVSVDDITLVPSDMMSIYVLQDGEELEYVAGVDLSEPMTSEYEMPIEDVYTTVSDSDDVQVKIVFENGSEKTWTEEDMWK